MVKFLPIPFIVYWLVVNDFLYNLDVCENNYNETGYCLSIVQCRNIVQGKRIGSCDTEIFGSVCCKITLKYFNETYLLTPIFSRKYQSEKTMKMMLFTANTNSLLKIEYGSNILSPERKKKIDSFDHEIHVSKSPNKIIWPIHASYSRENSDLQKKSSGQNYLYVVTLDKLDTDVNIASEGLYESHKYKSDDDEFYVVVNPSESFPIRNCFTTEKKQANTTNLTVDVNSLFEVEPDKQSRRSVYHSMCKQEDSTCTNQQWEDALNNNNKVENNNNQNKSETNRDIHKDTKRFEKCKKNNSIRDYVLDLKHILNEWMELQNVNKQPSNDKQNKDEITPDVQFFKKSTIKGKAEVAEEKHIVKFLRPYRSVKLDSFFVKDKYVFDQINPHLRTYVSKMKFENNLRTDNLKRSAPIENFPHVRYSVQIDATYNMRKPVQVEISHNMRKAMEVEETYDLKKPVQSEDTHDLRVPVQSEAAHDLRKPVQKESILDIENPVQIHTDNNMRKPMQILGESVDREFEHDLRKSVALHESHDLRWPVLEGETDLRHLDLESDASEKRSKLSVGKNANWHKFSSDCNVNVSFTNENSSLENPKEIEKIDVWKEASRVCGKYSEESIERSSSKLKENWPWMVSLHENVSGNYSHKCSASLLNVLWVITVAHCVDMKPKSDFKLVLGSSTEESSKENWTEIEVDEIVIHPKFNRGLFENDIALLRMKTPVIFQSNISPICLPWSVGELKYGTPVFLGWGLKRNSTSDDLEKLAVPLMTNYECEILYSTGKNKEKIKDTFLCAGKDNGNCDSESGSALIAPSDERRWSLIGMVSWGSMCTYPEQPGVYIRISSYAQWIKDVIDCYENLL